MKSMFEHGHLIGRSLDLINEMAMMMRNPDGDGQSSEGQHEDLVMSAWIAVQTYYGQIRYDMGDTEYTLTRGLKSRELLLRGANADDLVSMRLFDWLRDRRDRQGEREETLKEALEDFRGGQ